MKKAAYWLPVILLLGVIFHFSAQSSSRQDITTYIKEYQLFIKLLENIPDIHFYYHHHLISSHQDTVGFIQFIIRKIIHLCLYGILGIALLQAIENSGFVRIWRSMTQRWAVGSRHQPKHPPASAPGSYYHRRYFPFAWSSTCLTGMLIILIAALDEYQQSTVIDRTGCIEDVILDFCGFLLFNVLLHYWLRLRDLFY